MNFHHQNENLQKQIELLRKDADVQREAMKNKAKKHKEEIKMIEDSKTKIMNMTKNKDKEMKKLRQQLEDLEQAKKKPSKSIKKEKDDKEKSESTTSVIDLVAGEESTSKASRNSKQATNRISTQEPSIKSNVSVVAVDKESTSKALHISKSAMSRASAQKQSI